jgi:hypothetical protein
MPAFRFPWYRVIVFTLLIGAVAWWIHYRDLRLVEEEPVPAPAPGIRTPEPGAEPMVVFDVLPHEEEEGEPLLVWLRIGNVAYDVQMPGPGADPDLQRQAREQRESVLETLGEELLDLRRGAPDPDALLGEVRRGAAVPPDLYMAAFQLFIEAGYGKVNMVITEAKPPGRPPR